MNETEIALIREIVFTLGGGTLLLLVVLVIAAHLSIRYATARVDNLARLSMDRELARHKIELELSADSVRLDFQRRIQDFAEFNSRRHSTYQVLYKRLLAAEGAFAATTGGMLSIDYSQKTASEIGEDMKRLGIGQAARESVLKTWNEDRTASCELLDKYLAQARKNRAYSEHQKFKNSWLLRELYISEDVRAALHECNAAMASASAELLSSETDELRLLKLVRGELQGKTALVRQRMQGDLSRGDYSKPLGIDGLPAKATKG